MRASVTAAVLAAALVWAGPLAAQERDGAAEADEATERHVVRSGDTLWDLAGFYLSDPFEWPAIYELNRAVVEDPHWIFPDELLRIPGASAPLRASAVAATPAVAGQPRTLFYTASATAAATRRPTVLAAEEIRRLAVKPAEHRASPWLAQSRRLPVVGELFTAVEMGPVGLEDLGAGLGDDGAAVTVHSFDRVFLTYDERGARPRPGDRLLLVRVGRDIDDWGRLIKPTAVVTVLALHEDGFTALVSDHFRRIERGNVALPLRPFRGVLAAEPQPVRGGPVGELIAFAVEQPIYDKLDYAFVDLGRGSDVEPGDELVAYVPGRVEDGVELPPRPAARLQVIRARPNTATVRVMRLLHPVLEPGMPVRLMATLR